MKSSTGFVQDPCPLESGCDMQLYMSILCQLFSFGFALKGLLKGSKLSCWITYAGIYQQGKTQLVSILCQLLLVDLLSACTCGSDICF